MLRVATLLSLVLFICPAFADEAKTFAEFAKGKEQLDGYFPLLVDRTEGKVFVAIAPDRGEFIFQGSLPRGIGSNDIGLDRGQMGDTRLVVFERTGKRALLRQLNTQYRADSPNAAERNSAQEAFASSVLWGFNVVFSDAQRYVVDYTPFLLSDSHQVARRLKQAKQGEFKLDGERSAPYLVRTKAFPKNSELEATLTFVTNEPAAEIASVAPEATSVTVHAHHSLIEAPSAGFQMRAFHPYSGFWPFDFADYSQPIDRDLRRRYIPRHRLEKLNPTAARSEAIKPIVYYMDAGAPEPVRSALIEGARWWNSAFEAIGFTNALQIRDLPPDADPMDIRYNVIQWVHRSTRGWSYGASVMDPRTGEILKGHVTLGSLRVRQDLLIAQGLLSPFDGSDVEAPSRMALARLRQLAAHELGHTLGLAHNFAASMGNRGSVMDYPHPRVSLSAEGRVELADAYGTGLGPWDRFTIAYGYSTLSPEQESSSLSAMIEDAHKGGLRFITDADSRDLESFNALGHLWDDGGDVLAGLKQVMSIRKVSLEHFGANSIRSGTPWSELANVLAPIYYMHRYQTEAAARLVAGVDYDYSVKGEQAAMRNEPVSPATQWQAIGALLDTLAPTTLALAPTLVKQIPPPAFGYPATREAPPQRIGGALDPVTMAEAAGEHVLTLLLAPGRLARLQQQHVQTEAIPDASTLLQTIIERTIGSPQQTGLAGQIQKRIDVLVVEHLLQLAYDEAAVPETQAVARSAGRNLLASMRDGQKIPRAEVDRRYLSDLIDVAFKAQKFERRKNVAQMPPGAPI